MGLGRIEKGKEESLTINVEGGRATPGEGLRVKGEGLRVKGQESRVKSQESRDDGR